MSLAVSACLPSLYIYIYKSTNSNLRWHSMRAFRYEILLMNQLRHPNIVMLMGALWSDKMVGIVLEFAESGSLSDALKSKKISKNWTWQNPKLSIVCDIAQGMSFLHTTSFFDEKTKDRQDVLIHRDLKPGNVLLTAQFSAKVADFGTSKAFRGGKTDVEMTLTGTPIYMAPEIVRGENYDKSADVFSFAVTVLALECSKGDAYASFLGAVEQSEAVLGNSSRRSSKNQKNGEPLSAMQVMTCVAEHALRPTVSKQFPASVSALMQRCWSDRAKARPSFEEITEILNSVSRLEVLKHNKAEVQVSAKRRASNSIH